METNNKEKTLSIRKEDARDIMDIASRLQGEEAVEQIMRFVDMPKDSMTGDLSLKAVVRFYSNVRYLQERLQMALVNN